MAYVNLLTCTKIGLFKILAKKPPCPIWLATIIQHTEAEYKIRMDEINGAAITCDMLRSIVEMCAKTTIVDVIAQIIFMVFCVNGKEVIIFNTLSNTNESIKYHNDYM